MVPLRSDSFDTRAESYTARRVQLFNDATSACPHARETERRLLMDRLALVEGLIICDIAAGGGYLSDGIFEALGGRCRIICIENSPEFLRSVPDRYEKIACSLTDLRLDDGSVDRVAFLTGIHHQRDKARFFREAYRILRPGGIIGIADVLDGSPPACFLSDAVDRYADLGHDARFLAPNELSSLLAESGFADIAEDYCRYTWNFADEATLVGFCQKLFVMVKADAATVAAELRRHLRIESGPGGARLHWSLVYGRARKPVDA
jgi:SAM-dependent methyltransferase